MSGAAVGALVALGAFHGLNPGMGWLFAVSRGLYRRERRAVLAALGPIAIGHALSIAAVVGLVQAGRDVLPVRAVALAAAAALIGVGGWRLLRRRHLRWVGMDLSRRDLVLWSFLMATAHGAGLMLAPVLLGGAGPAALAGHAAEPTLALPVLAAVGPAAGVATAVAATLLHGLGMLAAMAGAALLVYDHVGLGILRRGWVDVDRAWAVALVAAGALVLFV